MTMDNVIEVDLWLLDIGKAFDEINLCKVRVLESAFNICRMDDFLSGELIISIETVFFAVRFSTSPIRFPQRSVIGPLMFFSILGHDLLGGRKPILFMRLNSGRIPCRDRISWQ